MADSVEQDPKKPKPDVEALKRMYVESQTDTFEGRQESENDRKRYYGFHWTAAEKRVFKKRKQPDNVWNLTRLAVNGTLGVLKQGQTDPRAYPRNPQDEDSADVASKTLRFIADAADFDAKKLDVAFDYLVPGTGACIIEADDDLKVTVEHIRWEEFFADPRSRRQDFSDARFMGIAKWQWADDLKAEYPDNETDIDACFTGQGLGTDELNDDKPRSVSNTVAWVHKTLKRVMTVEIYHREKSVWQRCKFVAGGVLEYGPSPYLNDKKQPICPIEAQSCYVDPDNNRSGMVRDLRGPNDEYNKRSAKLLHELNTRQVQETAPGQGMGERDEVREEAARPDGVMPSGWQIVPRQDIVSGQVRLMESAAAMAERFSPNPAILGRQGENQSGRSNLIRQQAGMTEQAMLYGGIEEWELRVYRQMWNRARQFWTAPMFIRETDDEGAPKFIGINQPPSVPVMGPDGQPVMGDDGEPQKQPLQPMPDPAGQPDEQGRVPQLMEGSKPAFVGPNGEKVLGYENALAELDVDIIIDTVPDTANVAQEQFQQLAELAKSYPQDVTFDDLLELSTMPNKRPLIEKRKARKEQAATQQQSPEAQIQVRGAIAEIENTEADTGLKRANEALTMEKAQNEGMKPELDVLHALHTAETKPPPQPPQSGGF
jgi:hypothetical protein